MQVGVTPTYVTPIQTNCYNYGYSVSCTTTGGDVYGGQTYSYDANAKLRDRVVGQCMEDLGYQAISLEQCPPGVLEKAGPVAPRMPAVANNSCAAKLPNGNWVILEK